MTLCVYDVTRLSSLNEILNFAEKGEKIVATKEVLHTIKNSALIYFTKDDNKRMAASLKNEFSLHKQT